MNRLALLAAGLALVLAPVAHAGHAVRHPVLVGRVGLDDAYTISLSFPNGKPVHTLTAGTYRIVVHDYSAIHNFALGSVTADRRIFTGSIPGISTKSYLVHLVPGTYAYACSAHPTTMHGSFVVHRRHR